MIALWGSRSRRRWHTCAGCHSHLRQSILYYYLMKSQPHPFANQACLQLLIFVALFFLGLLLQLAEQHTCDWCLHEALKSDAEL